MSAWEAVIGLECHVQLLTRSKMFSAAATAYGAQPNTQACSIDVALPGTLPVPNALAVRHAIRFGLAVQAPVARRSVFARKNYFYPDLPKGYQISQYAEPIVGPGTLLVPVTPERTLAVPIERAHLEEDAGKSVHDAFHQATALDFNRAGTPLLEIVSAPALHTAQEAAATMRTLHHLVCWLGICDGNLQEGSFRCDANVSVRRAGAHALGTRTEIKNLNSFRFVEKAVDYEIERQIRVLEGGGRIVQETRLYDETRQQTRTMRSKESAQDYRYFPDPDLPPLEIPESWLEAERQAMPELPQARLDRYVRVLGLGAAEAQQLTVDRATSDYFEQVINHLPASARAHPECLRSVAHWMNGELAAAMNAEQTTIAHSRVAPAALADLVLRVHERTLTHKLAKQVFAALWSGASDSVAAVIQTQNLGLVRDEAALRGAVEQVLAQNPKAVAQFRDGDEKVLSWLMGQVMRATQGKADPAKLLGLLQQVLRLP